MRYVVPVRGRTSVHLGRILLLCWLLLLLPDPLLVHDRLVPIVAHGGGADDWQRRPGQRSERVQQLLLDRLGTVLLRFAYLLVAVLRIVQLAVLPYARLNVLIDTRSGIE